MAAVPLDYDHPLGATTSIALARVPAANPATRIGAVFVNPGGPGGSGVSLILSDFGAAAASLLQGRFDVIGFDPRGVASSDPLQCFDTNEESAAFAASTPVFPYRSDQERPYFDIARSLAGICFDRGAPITRHMSTADVVRDLDLLRRAVGDERLTYLGFSYGTYIGSTYANMFPDKVRALVLDGVLDPRLWSSGWQIFADRTATGQEFAEFLRLCDEAGSDCALSAPGGSAARYQALADALLKQPLAFEDGSAYSYDFLVSDTTSAMYVPEQWREYAAFFAALADAVLGDTASTHLAFETRRKIRLAQAMPHRELYDNSMEAYYGTLCADAGFPRSFAAYHAIGVFARSGSIFGPLWWWGNASCATWPVAADRYIGPWSTRTAAPVLVVGNFFDGVTDYDGAVATSKLLRDSRLLSYAGWGHTALGRSECVTSHVLSYLLDGTLPPEGTVCPANPNPFLARMPQLRAGAQKLPMVGRPPQWPGRHGL